MVMNAKHAFEVSAALKHAGLKEEGAEALVTALEDGMALTIKQVMDEHNARMDAKFAQLEAKFDTSISQLDAKMSGALLRHTLAIGGVMLAVLAIVLRMPK
jgi:hypothetical protein